MLYDFNKNSRESLVKKYAGGKGYSLFLLANNDLPVPDFRILGRNAFAGFIGVNRLKPQIDRLVEQPDEAMTIEHGNTIHRKIERLFQEAPFPGEVETAIDRILDEFDQQPIAVRSSAAGEDAAAHSFAGQLSSYLYLQDKIEIKDAVKKCWASAYTARSLAYRRSLNLSDGDIQMAVIFQEMIDPDVSGVMFTQNAVNSRPQEILINAVFGAGEGLVSGALDADTFSVERTSGAISAEITAKRQRFAADPDRPGGCRSVPVASDRAEQPALTEAQIGALADLGLIAENLFQFPQDVEFAFKNGTAFILQSRPITAIADQAIYRKKGRIRIWDNSNIVESYAGVTTPLTFSFAAYAYEQVYVQLCEVMGVSRHRIEANADIYKNMIGLIDGRIYYNLGNWYRLLSLFPAFKHNRSAMETMMGVRESLPAEVAGELVAGPSKKSFGDVIERLKVGVHLVKYHLSLNRSVERFFDRFRALYRHYDSICYRRMSMDQIVASYKEFRRKMLHHWKVPLISDFLTMIHFNLLKRLSDVWCQDLGNGLHNDLLSGQGGIESAELARQIVELSASVVKDQGLLALFETCDEETIYEQLQRKPEFEKFNRQIERYLKKYGFRCMGELKLEETDLNTDPCQLFTMIRNYVRAGRTDVSAYLKNEKKLRHKAEAKIARHLTGGKKLFLRWALKHARNTVRHRENLRFARTRVFGLCRRMFQAVGEDLTRKGLLAHPSDVFYLTVDELIAFSEGRSTLTDLRGLSQLRKKEYQAYRDKGDPDERFHTRGVVYTGNTWNSQAVVPDLKPPQSTLAGIPCCPGAVTGTAKVILSHADDLALSGEILAAPRTDPGWVPLFPSISGLLVERGSLLSHSAIVARELGVPTIIKVNNLLDHIRSGDRLAMDATRGIIHILKGQPCETG